MYGRRHQYCNEAIRNYELRSAGLTDHQFKLGVAKTAVAVFKVTKRERRQYEKIREELKKLGYDVQKLDSAWLENEVVVKKFRTATRRYLTTPSH